MKKIIALLLALAAVTGSMLPISFAEEYKVQGGSSEVKLNGITPPFVLGSGYLINNYNYYQLRYLANIFHDTNSRFDVTWNNSEQTIEITTNTPYSAYTEFGNIPENIADTAIHSRSDIKVDGKSVELVAYVINGYTYFKLRDIGELVGFSVEYDSTNGNVLLTDKPMEQGEFRETPVDIIGWSDDEIKYTHTYTATGRLTKAFLNPMQNGFEVVNVLVSEIEVSSYTKDRSYVSTKYIDMELPLFGGFFAGRDYYYIAFGQENLDEDNEKEVIRVVKYDKDWNRISHASVKDCYTTIPFDAGTLKMDEKDGELVVYTSRERYLTPDGKNHQSQLIIKIDTVNMVTTNYLGAYQEVYASHSFNQFVKYDNGEPVYVDLGDGYPRAVALNGVSVLDIPGLIGDNNTAVTIGGFEISDATYIIAYSSANFDTEYYERFVSKNSWDMTRDIKTLIINKSDGTVRELAHTKLEENKKLCQSPYLVKINNDRYALLWTEFTYIGMIRSGVFEYSDVVKYLEIDKNGNHLTEIKTLDNVKLSKDCEPKVVGDEILWYADTAKREFYSIAI